jgi:hypothetical protein
VPAPQRQQGRFHPGLVRQAPRLKLGAQPVYVGEDLAAQGPAFGAFGGVGTEQVGQPVLLAVRLLQVVFQFLGDRLSRGVGVAGGNRVGLEELTVGADGGGQLGQHGS